jgi:hypothetical protein
MTLMSEMSLMSLINRMSLTTIFSPFSVISMMGWMKVSDDICSVPEVVKTDLVTQSLEIIYLQ